MARLVTTQSLYKINDWAVKNKMERFMPAEIVNILDDNGIHFCIHQETISLPYIEPYIRTLWVLKIKGSKIPKRVSIDIEAEVLKRYSDEVIESEIKFYNRA